MGKKIHLIGVGGVGMAALAVLLKSQGHDVSGCDISGSKRLDWLKEQGVRVFDSHSPDHIKDVDEVVVTPAVDAESAELVEARKMGRAIISRGFCLAQIASQRPTVAVCGSHGKTTTSTFIAKLLLALGEDVAWAIGGECGEMPVARAGKGVLVVEADESDATLVHYRVKTLVVNKCEYDHPDHFKSEEEYFNCFEIAKANAEEVIDSESLDLDGWVFPVAGEHNWRNARAAVEVALRLGYKKEDIIEALPKALELLPDRRFQRLADGVYTDYAHHPTEMKCAITMAREVCKGTLRVVFQPHRYSRTKALLENFPAALSGGDEVIICPTYAAFEKPVEGGDEADLYCICRKAGLNVYLARSVEEAWTHTALSSKKGDVTLLLGAGDIIKVASWVKEGRILDEKRIWLGAGSNTWRSDLKTNEVYVKSSCRSSQTGASLSIPWMTGIPGTVGGWIKMNAGAFGHSISELIESVKVDGKWLDADECGFGYRKSSIKGEIQDFKLKPYEKDEALSKEYAKRRSKFPAGTKGSVFKNPPGDFVGRLLESAGAKSLSVGSAFVWQSHANVIVQQNEDRASDFLALSRLMRLKVFYRFGVILEPEVRGLDVKIF